MKAKKILSVFSIIIFVVAIVALVLFLLFSFRTNKLSCTSQQGDIIITYDEQGITGYTASTTFDYNLEGQQQYAERVGIDYYLDEFTGWFEAATEGTCNRN